MVNIKPIINILTTSANKAGRFVQRPNLVSVNPLTLRPAIDQVCLSTKPCSISIEEVQKLFPTGKLENNYIINDIKDLLSRIKTERKIIDLTPELSEKDYEIIQKLINRDNGRFIEKWKGYSDTDIVPNAQKLALFTRTMRLTHQTNEFIEFSPNQWEMVYEGIVRKPKEMIMPLLEYKANSNPINIPLGEKKITAELKNIIDKITEYINMFTVKKDFVGYRGDKSFNILSNVKVEGQDINLAELMEIASNKFRQNFLNKNYNVVDVDKFVKRYLINQKIAQPRFISIGMTESSVKDYAKKIKWNIKIPKGTKGASIESYNVERLNEAEFLGQRNGVLKIRDARYCPKKDLWYFDAVLKQNPVDEIIVTC